MLIHTVAYTAVIPTAYPLTERGKPLGQPETAREWEDTRVTPAIKNNTGRIPLVWTDMSMDVRSIIPVTIVTTRVTHKKTRRLVEYVIVGLLVGRSGKSIQQVSRQVKLTSVMSSRKQETWYTEINTDR